VAYDTSAAEAALNGAAQQNQEYLVRRRLGILATKYLISVKISFLFFFL
jgi:hypothetical protein|tara:strand:+ start:12034 stop:12180 length:147 start_codon:yes stop_codon:yes gene_type:complete